MTTKALKTRLSVALFLLLSACGAGLAAPGWQGEDVHLVNGTWVGTETACGAHDLVEECRLLVEHAMGAVDPQTRSKVASAVIADLPTMFVTATGETRTASRAGGLQSRRVVILDLADGTRLVIGLICRLPYSGATGRLLVEEVTCKVDPLDEWRHGNAPR